MIKWVVLVVVLIASYVWFTRAEQEKIAEQKEQREIQIMEKQRQFMEQSRDLGKQLQQDLDHRMQE